VMGSDVSLRPTLRSPFFGATRPAPLQGTCSNSNAAARSGPAATTCGCKSSPIGCYLMKLRNTETWRACGCGASLRGVRGVEPCSLRSSIIVVRTSCVLNTLRRPRPAAPRARNDRKLLFHQPPASPLAHRAGHRPAACRPRPDRSSNSSPSAGSFGPYCSEHEGSAHKMSRDTGRESRGAFARPPALLSCETDRALLLEPPSAVAAHPRLPGVATPATYTPRSGRSFRRGSFVPCTAAACRAALRVQGCARRPCAARPCRACTLPETAHMQMRLRPCKALGVAVCD